MTFQENCDKLDCMIKSRLDEILNKPHHKHFTFKYDGFFLSIQRNGDWYKVCFKEDLEPLKTGWCNPLHMTIATKMRICGALDDFNQKYTAAFLKQEQELEAFVNGKSTL